METISDYLVRRLREIGPAAWPSAQEATGVSVHLMRKVAYGDRPNPGIKKIESLYLWLRENDSATKEAA